MTERPATPRLTVAATKPPSPSPSPIRAQPMTPKSPAVRHETARTKDQRSSPPSPTSLAVNSAVWVSKDMLLGARRLKTRSVRSETIVPEHQQPTTSSFTSTSSKASNSTGTLPSRPQLPNRTPTPQRSNPEISLTLQNWNGTWDLDNKYPAPSYLGVLDLGAFFAFFSQRSGVALADLDYLTFKLIFGEHPQQIEVINKNSGDEGWKKLKDKIRKFFKFVRNGNRRESDFDVWVEIGNKKDVLQEESEDSVGL